MPIEEIILEAVDKSSKNNYSKLLIKRRSSDGVYFCELSLRRYENTPADSKSNSNEVLFRLGFCSDAEKYIQQYVQIFTEEGRRAVNIRHNLIENTTTPKNFENSTSSQLNSIQNRFSNSAAYSTIKKPQNTSCVCTGVSFQSLFNSNNMQIVMFFPNPEILQTIIFSIFLCLKGF